MSTLATVIQRGTRASQPVASSVAIGTLYFVTDENVTERSSGSAWQSYSGPAAVASNPVQATIIREESFIEESIPIPGLAGSGSGGTGKIVQVVNTQTGAFTTSSTIIPFDDTIPQITEGVEIFTRSITPTSSSNILDIDIVIFATSTATPWIIVSLFQDATSNPLATCASFVNLNTSGTTIAYRHTMTAGTTSSTTFRVRVGPSSAATITVNGQSGARIFGGVAASGITVTERTP